MWQLIRKSLNYCFIGAIGFSGLNVVTALLFGTEFLSSQVFAQPSADFNNDRVVGFIDYLMFASKFGTNDDQIDLDGDGVVTYADYLILISQVNEICEHRYIEPIEPEGSIYRLLTELYDGQNSNAFSHSYLVWGSIKELFSDFRRRDNFLLTTYIHGREKEKFVVEVWLFDVTTSLVGAKIILLNDPDKFRLIRAVQSPHFTFGWLHKNNLGNFNCFFIASNPPVATKELMYLASFEFEVTEYIEIDYTNWITPVVILAENDIDSSFNLIGSSSVQLYTLPELGLDFISKTPTRYENLEGLAIEIVDQVQFRLFAPTLGGVEIYGYTFYLTLDQYHPSSGRSNYMSNISSLSGVDLQSNPLVVVDESQRATISMTSPTKVKVPDSGYLGEVNIILNNALEDKDTRLHLSLNEGNPTVATIERVHRILTWGAHIVLLPTNISCPGDFDKNGIVNVADFLAFVDVFGARSGDDNYNQLMDTDGNGWIDIPDFLDFVAVFGTTCN